MNKLEWPPSMSKEDLKQFVLDYTAGRIFTNQHCANERMVTLVFMVLALGGFNNITDEQASNIGLIYEYMSKAGPRSINGCPIFFSCRFMNKADFERVKTAILKEEERRKDIEV